MSYLSSSDPRIHFGLGDTTRLDSVLIEWPDGWRDTLSNVVADRTVVVQQGKMSGTCSPILNPVN